MRVVQLKLCIPHYVGGQPVHKIIPHLPIPLMAIFVGTLLVVLFPGIVTFLPSVL